MALEERLQRPAVAAVPPAPRMLAPAGVADELVMEHGRILVH